MGPVVVADGVVVSVVAAIFTLRTAVVAFVPAATEDGTR